MSDNGDNGAGRVEVDMERLGPGWVVFQAGRSAPAAKLLPELLCRTMIGWLQAHPECAVRSTLPIVVEGNTVAIHVWFTAGP